MVINNVFERTALGNMCHDRNTQDDNSSHHTATPSKYILTHTARSIHPRDMEDRYQSRIVFADDELEYCYYT